MINQHSIRLLHIADIFQKYLNRVFPNVNLYINKAGRIALTPSEKILFQNNNINFELATEITFNKYEQNFNKLDEEMREKFFYTKKENCNQIAIDYHATENLVYLYQQFLINFHRLYNDIDGTDLPDFDITRVQVYMLSKLIRIRNVPVITIDNDELIDMINDTDLEPVFDPKDVKLPFNQFLLKFMLNGNVIELLVRRLEFYLEDLDETQIVIYAQGIRGMPDCYTLEIIPIAGEVTAECEGGNKDDILFSKTLSQFIKKLMYFFSIEKTIEYIDKTITSNKAKKKLPSLKEQKYGVTIIDLFKDIRYNYKKLESLAGTKISHIVRGHFRKQPYGTRENPEFRIIWIKPYLTGSGEIKENKRYSLVK